MTPFLRGGVPRRSLLRRAFSSSPRSSEAKLSLGGQPHRIAIVGAGPSGFYAATRLLALPDSQNTRVDLYEALPVPFGLARFGVAPDHPEVKNCEHKFEETARDPRFRFFGNVELVAPSSNPPVLSSLAAQVPLARLTPHYDAILLSYGASLSRPLPLPGSTLSYILPARSLVAWYNGHPSLSPGGALSPLSSTSPPGDIDLSKIETVTLIGQGNVALDLARLLLKPVDSLSTTDLPSPVLDALAKSRVRRVRIVGRRGPLQLAATTKEVRELMALPNVAFRVDHVQLHAAMRECEAHPGMQGARGKKRALEVMRKGSATKPGTEGAKEWSFEFFKSPLEFFGREGEEGRVGSVEWGVNELGPGKEGDDDPADFVARSTGRTVRDETDLVLTSVGYRSEEIPGIPFDARRGVVLNEGGRVLTAPAGEPIKALYVSGWLARGPTGVIANTMYDAFATADLIATDLSLTAPRTEPLPDLPIEELRGGRPVVSWEAWERLDHEERRRGEALGKVREKMTSVEEMLAFVTRT